MKNIIGVSAGLLLGSVALNVSAQEQHINIFGKEQTACTRASLQAAADSYVAAQKAGDASKMALADDAKFFENMEAITADKGRWNKALPISYTNSFVDPARCKTFVEIIVAEGDYHAAIGTRLNVANGKITEINGLITDKGDWLFNAVAFNKFAQTEDWGKLKPEQRVSAQELINAANGYLDLFSDKYVQAPFALPCERIEGGAYTKAMDQKRKADLEAEGKGAEYVELGCKGGIPDGVLYIVNRSYVVDEERGVVNVFCRFGNSTNGMPDSHTFRLVDGKFRHVHTLSVQMNPDAPSPQATDDGLGAPSVSANGG